MNETPVKYKRTIEITEEELNAVEDIFTCEVSEQEYKRIRPLLANVWQQLCPSQGEVKALKEREQVNRGKVKTYEGEVDLKANENLAPFFMPNFQVRELAIGWEPANLITKVLRRFLNFRFTYRISGISFDENNKT